MMKVCIRFMNLNVSTQDLGFHSRFSNREIQGLKNGFKILQKIQALI